MSELGRQGTSQCRNRPRVGNVQLKTHLPQPQLSLPPPTSLTFSQVFAHNSLSPSSAHKAPFTRPHPQHAAWAPRPQPPQSVLEPLLGSCGILHHPWQHLAHRPVFCGGLLDLDCVPRGQAPGFLALFTQCPAQTQQIAALRKSGGTDE